MKYEEKLSLLMSAFLFIITLPFMVGMYLLYEGEGLALMIIGWISIHSLFNILSALVDRLKSPSKTEVSG